MANDSTVNTEVVDTEVQDVNNNSAPQTENVSSENKVWDEKYPKWQKMLPKDYWGSEKLSKYDSLTSVIEDAITPKTKAPEKYDFNVGSSDFNAKLSESLKKADVGTAEANEIAELFKNSLPKAYTEEDEKETFGLGDYEVVKAYKEKAINTICGNDAKLKESIEKSEFFHNPAFVNFARIVGKNLGNSAVEDFTNERTPDTEDVWAKMIAQKHK